MVIDLSSLTNVENRKRLQHGHQILFENLLKGTEHLYEPIFLYVTTTSLHVETVSHDEITVLFFKYLSRSLNHYSHWTIFEIQL